MCFSHLYLWNICDYFLKSQIAVMKFRKLSPRVIQSSTRLMVPHDHRFRSICPREGDTTRVNNCERGTFNCHEYHLGVHETQKFRHQCPKFRHERNTCSNVGFSDASRFLHVIQNQNLIFPCVQAIMDSPQPKGANGTLCHPSDPTDLRCLRI